MVKVLDADQIMSWKKEYIVAVWFKDVYENMIENSQFFRCCQIFGMDRYINRLLLCTMTNVLIYDMAFDTDWE